MRKQANARSRNNLGNNVSDTASDLDFTAETIRIERQWNARSDTRVDPPRVAILISVGIP
jgi:hypothetical protein